MKFVLILHSYILFFTLYRFSQAKKCSNEGRALMQLDFQQYRTQIEKMSHIRSVIVYRTVVQDQRVFRLVKF